MSTDKPLFSIVIPVYKSVHSLQTISEETVALFKNLGKTFEIIFVNDSPFWADTCSMLVSLQKKYSPHIYEIRMRRNRGQHLALLAGLSVARGDYIITMDDDLQHPVREIPKLIEAMDQDPLVEAIFAVPKYRQKKHQWYRNLGSWFMQKFEEVILDKPPGLIKSSFRMIRRNTVAYLLKYYNATPAVSNLLILATKNISNVHVMHEKRKFGKSHYTFYKLICLTFNNLVQYTAFPLAFIGTIGVLSFIFSNVFILVILVRKYMLSINFPGYASTVILISFFGGLNLLGIGIIGEYLSRIIKEQQKIDLKDLYVAQV